MKRAVGLIVLAAAALVPFRATSPAIAASPGATRDGFHGAYVDAVWGYATPTSEVQASITASKASLLVTQSTAHFDPGGAFTGATSVTAEVNRGYSFSIDSSGLTRASASATRLPASACAYGPDGSLIGCEDTTVSLSASWSGLGLIGKETAFTRFNSCLANYVYLSHGRFRDGAARGTVNDLRFTAADQMSADLGTVTSAEVDFEVNSRCQGARPWVTARAGDGGPRSVGT